MHPPFSSLALYSLYCLKTAIWKYFFILTFSASSFCLSLCLHQELNMDIFEEQFKTRAQGNPKDLSNIKTKVVQKAPSKTSLIDANKAKNLAITLRKGGMTPSAICTAIETYVLHGNPAALLTFLSYSPFSLLYTTWCDFNYSFVQVWPAVFVFRLPGITWAVHTIRFWDEAAG